MVELRAAVSGEKAAEKDERVQVLGVVSSQSCICRNECVVMS